MGDHPNTSLAHDLLDAFNQRNVERLREILAEDVKWHMIGGETAEGVDALVAPMDVAGDEFAIETVTHDIVGNDDHVVALVNAKATVGGQTFEYRTAEILHVENGKVTERWAFSDDTDAINRFFGQFA